MRGGPKFAKKAAALDFGLARELTKAKSASIQAGDLAGGAFGETGQGAAGVGDIKTLLDESDSGAGDEGSGKEGEDGESEEEEIDEEIWFEREEAIGTEIKAANAWQLQMHAKLKEVRSELKKALKRCKDKETYDACKMEHDIARQRFLAVGLIVAEAKAAEEVSAPPLDSPTTISADRLRAHDESDAGKAGASDGNVDILAQSNGATCKSACKPKAPLNAVAATSLEFPAVGDAKVECAKSPLEATADFQR
jgi:hypothetical protein